MKFFVLACLIAAAVAEPAAEAEADPAYLYGASRYAYSPYYNNYRAYSPYAYGYRSAFYNPYGYSAFRRFYKREAEAEPEADPALLYANTAYATPYAYTPYSYAYNHYSPLSYATHYTAPAVTTAYAAPVATTAYTHTVAAPAVVAAPTVYNAVRPYSYYANSGGAVHAVNKREAEAEADPAYLYSAGYPYTPYASYAYGHRAYSAYTPYSYGYRSAFYNPYSAYRYYY